MAHWNFSSTPNFSEMDHDQFRNSFNPEPRLPFENGAFAFPVDNVAVSGVNSIPYLNAPLRPINYPSSSMEIPHYRSTTAGNSDLHQHHQSTGSSTSFMPPTNAQQGPCYSHYMIPADECRNLYSQVDSGRGSIKRKSPATSMFSHTGSTSTNWHYSNASSSDMTASSDHPQQKPWLSSHPWYWDPNGSAHNYNDNNFLVSGEGFQRSVRSRHSHAPHLDANLGGTHFSSNLPCHFPSDVDFPCPGVNAQWGNHPMSGVSHGRIPPGLPGFNHMTRINQSFVSSTTSASMEPSASHHNNTIPSRHLVAPLPIIPGPSQSMSEAQSNCRQRIGSSSRSTTCCPNLVFTLPEIIGQSGPGAFSRPSRPLSISGGRNVRNGRPRFSHGRYQPYSDDNSGHSRWMSEGALMMDQSTFYESANLLDQHRDMRLDIDDMSYEELLALEERIGSVNTGLSEDMLSKCLVRTTYCSSGQMHDLEGSCVICLESYNDTDELGTLKCGHDYHVECIKKWLLMKNVCPICKACAVGDASKEEE